MFLTQTNVSKTYLTMDSIILMSLLFYEEIYSISHMKLVIKIYHNFESFSSCTGNAECINYVGGFYCQCIPPYVGDGVEYCMNEADYITIGNVIPKLNSCLFIYQKSILNFWKTTLQADLQRVIADATVKIEDLKQRWNETLEMFRKSENETNQARTSKIASEIF